ncbi:WD repeat-containing protein 18 [Geodia barretti]|uniref:WD repeat-containing protein 18 n=1 Tax=Geodia barretti TaxID=519541 RepID=A0AA35WA04_GEOBA|nr:WD repeat-containing protein 18 [Geodia barretti]
MSEEVVLSCVSSSGGKGVKIAAWSPGKGAIQRTYSSETEGGGAALAMLGKTHIMCALKSIPFIYVWHVRKEQVLMKMACPGLVRALAVSPDCVYCAGAIADKIHIWQVSTGHLLAVEGRHYQPVSVLLFTDDGQSLVSGGEDGRVLVWSLQRLVSQAFDSSGVSLPHSENVSMGTRPHPPVLHHTWSDHALPVTSLHCGAGGLRARLASASLDQTCKLYDMASGQLLCSVLFGFSLTAVAMDTAEQWLFVGGATGRISRVNLTLQRMAPLHGMSAASMADSGFKGHTQAVTSLAVCDCGLASGSEDGTCRLWDIASGQATRVLQMKGGVVQSLVVWGVALSGHGKKTGPESQSVFIAPFHKQLLYTDKNTALDCGQFVLRRTIDPFCELYCSKSGV